MSITTRTGYRINPQSGQSYGNAPSWFKQVEAIFSQQGVPPQYWIPIAVQESGLNPSAVSSGPNHSVGLFQLNPVGGQGVGYPHSELLNPVSNAKIAAPYIASAYHAGVAKGLSGQSLLNYTAANSGHLGDIGHSAFTNTFTSLSNGQPLKFPSGALYSPSNYSPVSSSSSSSSSATTGNSANLNVSGFSGGAAGIAQLDRVFNPPSTAFGLSTLAEIGVRTVFGGLGLVIAVVGILVVTRSESGGEVIKNVAKTVK